VLRLEGADVFTFLQVSACSVAQLLSLAFVLLPDAVCQQGLVTNDMRLLQDGTGARPGLLQRGWALVTDARLAVPLSPTAAVLYTALLNSGGRILHDAFLFRDPASAAVFVDTPAQGSSDVLAHLRRYRLRAAVSLDDVTPEWRVWAALPPGGGASETGGDASSSGPTAQWPSDPRLQVRTERPMSRLMGSLLSGDFRLTVLRRWVGGL
jgi:folate-binding Fe-S cluster repair protein YgfZ